MFDEPLGDRHPNPEQRLVRRADLFRELLNFLDDFKESPDDGWPELTCEDHHALYAIMGEILDLKFGRDCDGDRSITYSIYAKTGVTPVAYTIPYFRGEIADTEAFMEWLCEASEASRMASSYADYAAKNIENTVRQRRDYETAKRERIALYESLPDKVAELSFEEASDLMVETYTTAFKYDDISLIAAAQELMAGRFGEELFRGITQMSKAMAKFTTEQDVAFHNEVRGPRTRLTRIFGKAFSQHPDIQTRSHELYIQGAEDRKVAREARELKRKQMSCDHDWQKTDNWRIDRCTKCGEERA